MTTSFERRRPGQGRLPIRVPALTEASGAGGAAGHGETQNLSAGGLLLELEQALRPGDRVQVTLSLSRRPPLVLTGTVAWVQPPSDFSGRILGITFSNEWPGEVVAEIAHAEYPPWRPRPF